MAEIPANSPNVDQWLKLIHADGVGPVLFARLLKRFGSAEAALGTSASQLAKVDGVGYKTAERIAATREQFDAERELALARKAGVWLVHLKDQHYPRLLGRIYDPPPVLYVKGTLDRGDALAISIVGSRRCSLYGTEQASRLAHFLGAAGFTICSGMARGIDTAAHEGALAAGARTIAVQGCGLARVFPPENRKLFGMIAGQGACLSELPMETDPRAENFPPRNRIVAGLSLGTIVLDAPPRSGALITARAALDYNREVMAVPGKVDSPASRGPHLLIKQGARLVEGVEDVMEALGYVGEQLQEHAQAKATEAEQAVDATLFDSRRPLVEGDERTIHETLTKEPAHIDEIIARTGLGAGTVNSTLISLRLKGLIRQFPGNSFARR